MNNKYYIGNGTFKYKCTFTNCTNPRIMHKPDDINYNTSIYSIYCSHHYKKMNMKNTIININIEYKNDKENKEENYDEKENHDDNETDPTYKKRIIIDDDDVEIINITDKIPDNNIFVITDSDDELPSYYKL